MPRLTGVLSNTAVRTSVCPMAQLSQAMGTLVACSVAMCGLRTRPRTNVDPPRVKLPSAGGISSRRSRGDNLYRWDARGVNYQHGLDARQSLAVARPVYPPSRLLILVRLRPSNQLFSLPTSSAAVAFLVVRRTPL